MLPPPSRTVCATSGIFTRAGIFLDVLISIHTIASHSNVRKITFPNIARHQLRLRGCEVAVSCKSVLPAKNAPNVCTIHACHFLSDAEADPA